jgi:hypothetical protein
VTREIIRDDDGTPLAAICGPGPLDDEARGHFAELARVVQRDMREKDPDGLQGDRQRRAIDRVHRRTTPDCDKPGCQRIEGHDGRCTPDLPAGDPT